ncbi:ADP-forming succinate--CoA ligase subunit beta [uncultured Bacteroides sp.]|uniref:ADP-forming succinate--CoA ligase subunit beta n=1 Tax=uncultured Bacteroides sp. TaxID=162156 RepID=UPI002AAB9BD9|nr:ADP-forming succinate--CoA ligase subunit beta [uncultured Bacteroides sp.]
MKIHEYQAKNLLSSYGIPVEQHILCQNADEALLAYEELNMKKVMIKAQVQAGGRGKAGGIKLAKSADDVMNYASSILQMTIKGLPVTKILVSEAINIESEFYLSFSIDRKNRSVIMMLSSEGGVEIEEVAKYTPENIYRVNIDPFVGLPSYIARRIAFFLFDDMDLVNQMVQILQKMYQLFIDQDASLIEVNPLVLTEERNLIAVDAKMTFDDCALYRQEDICFFSEPTEEEEMELQAKAKGFNYVHLTGDIGCMVNGAGLAMATMDMIKLYEGSPANFLDIGGSSNPKKITEAMKMLLQDDRLKVILVNIFGGITRCDDVANGLLKAYELLHADIPVVVRLTGTNEEEGRALLRTSSFIVAETMKEAIKIAVNQSIKAG